MLSLPLPVKIYASVEPVDCRKSFDSLAALVREQLSADPLSGHLFVFRNRRGDRIKLLYWDRDGFVIWMKRLEVGSVRFPDFAQAMARQGACGIELRASELMMILDGVELSSVQRRKRYQRPEANSQAPPAAAMS